MWVQALDDKLKVGKVWKVKRKEGKVKEKDGKVKGRDGQWEGGEGQREGGEGPKERRGKRLKEAREAPKEGIGGLRD